MYCLELEVQAYAYYVVLTSVVASSTVCVCELVIVVERVHVTKVELQLVRELVSTTYAETV